MAKAANHVLLGPQRCRGCGRRALELLCRSCVLTRPRPDTTGAVANVDVVLAPWAYDSVARALILELKLRGGRAAAVPLARAMAAEARRHGLLAEILTWVPGRRSDERRRGYDHAHELARLCGTDLGLPVRPLLRRVRNPLDQTSLGAAARRDNLRGVFVGEACPSHVALVDDLLTTGATAQSCARALRAGGATRVELLVPARA